MHYSRACPAKRLLALFSTAGGNNPLTRTMFLTPKSKLHHRVCSDPLFIQTRGANAVRSCQSQPKHFDARRANRHWCCTKKKKKNCGRNMESLHWLWSFTAQTINIFEYVLFFFPGYTMFAPTWMSYGSECLNQGCRNFFLLGRHTEKYCVYVTMFLFFFLTTWTSFYEANILRFDRILEWGRDRNPSENINRQPNRISTVTAVFWWEMLWLVSL